MNIVLNTLSHMSKLGRMNAWVYKKFRVYAGNRVMEAGCGNGNITSLLLDRQMVMAVDNDESMLSEIKKRFALNSNVAIRRLDLSSMPVAELKAFNFDTVLCINALEHISDDSKVLDNFHAILEDGGYLILIVPAFKGLFCALDKAAGHFRRYSKREIEEKIRACGFSCVKLSYYNFFGIFGWLVNGVLLRREQLSNKMLSLFDRLVPFFELFENISGPPLGLSIVAVCRKESKK